MKNLKQLLLAILLLNIATAFSQRKIPAVKFYDITQGTKNDSIFVFASDGLIKYVPRTVYLSGLGGAGTPDGNDFLTSVTESGGTLTFNVPNQTNPTFDFDNFLSTKNYSTGAHTVDTNTQLTQAQVGTYATNEGFIKTFTEVDGSVTNELQNGSEINLTGYSKPASFTSVLSSDTVNEAIGKLEKGLDDATSGGVTSVAGKTGAVTLVENDISDFGNYSTDIHSNITALNNVSGVNTGDQDLTPYITFANANAAFEPIKGADDNFVTDAEKIVIGNTSGINTGDQDFDVTIDGNYLTTIDKNTNLNLLSGSGIALESFSSHSGNSLVIRSTFSNSYNDLYNTPTIPTNNNQLTNGAGYALDNGVVHDTGNEDVYGQKSFQDNLTVEGQTFLKDNTEIDGYLTVNEDVRVESGTGQTKLYIGNHIEFPYATNYNQRLRLLNNGIDYVGTNASGQNGTPTRILINNTGVGANIAFREQSGTVALLSDIPTSSGGSSGTNTTFIQGAGRVLMAKDNRWITDSDDVYGFNKEDFTETAGTGAEPIVAWETRGVPIPPNYKIKKIYLSGRTNSTEITDLEIRVYKRRNSSSYTQGVDSDGEMTNTEIYSGNWFDSGTTYIGDSRDNFDKEITTTDSSNSNISQATIYFKPIGTIASNRYFYMSYTIELEYSLPQ